MIRVSGPSVARHTRNGLLVTCRARTAPYSAPSAHRSREMDRADSGAARARAPAVRVRAVDRRTPAHIRAPHSRGQSSGSTAPSRRGAESTAGDAAAARDRVRAQGGPTAPHHRASRRLPGRERSVGLFTDRPAGVEVEHGHIGPPQQSVRVRVVAGRADRPLQQLRARACSSVLIRHMCGTARMTGSHASTL